MRASSPAYTVKKYNLLKCAKSRIFTQSDIFILKVLFTLTFSAYQAGLSPYINYLERISEIPGRLPKIPGFDCDSDSGSGGLP